MKYEFRKLGYHMKLIITYWITAYDVSQHQSTRINHPVEVQHEPSPHLSGIYAFTVFTSIPLHLHKHLFDIGHRSIAKPEILFFRFSILFMSLSCHPTFGAPSIKISWYFSWVELLLGLWMVTACKHWDHKHWSEFLPVASLMPELRLDILLDQHITLAYTSTYLTACVGAWTIFNSYSLNRSCVLS